MISVAIMSHPSREAWVRELVERLDGPSRTVWDEIGVEWDTGRRALAAYSPNASHHLVIQDDAIICRDLVAGCERIAEVSGEHPISLYMGGVRPYRDLVERATREAEQLGRCWVEMPGPWWGVAVMLPTDRIEEMLAWAERRTARFADYDIKIKRFWVAQGIDCRYTVPSLVDHRPVSENPSLLPGHKGDRRAHRFLGADRSALELDWSSEPLAVAA